MSELELAELKQLSWLELQRQKCAAKTKYFNEASAKEAAKRRPKKPHGKMRVYYCSYCGWWHMAKAHPVNSVPYEQARAA